MSSIGSISGAGSAWYGASAVRPTRPPSGPDPAEAFAKVDTDGSGSVDATELQSLLDKVPAQNGSDTTTASATDTLKKFDSNSDGSLSEEELDQGMKSLMPAPSSTVDFARQHGGGGPPPAAGAGAGASQSYDPLDTNQDGVVSPQEQAVGDATQATLESLMKAIDTDKNGELSSSEMDTFKQVLAEHVDGITQAAQAGSNGAQAGSTADASSRHDSGSQRPSLDKLASMVLKQYAAMADAAGRGSASQLALAA